MTRPQSASEVHRTILRATSASIVAAREFVISTLGARLAERHGDIALVTSELFTNAIEHGDGAEVDVDVFLDDLDGVAAGVTVSVCSASTALPVQRADCAPLAEISGRGLHIVAALADAVDVRSDGTRVCVAAQFSA